MGVWLNSYKILRLQNYFSPSGVLYRKYNSFTYTFP